MKILLTGKSGQVGWELQRSLATLGVVCAVDIEDVDLTDAAKTEALVQEVRPELIVHSAAYTAVDKAESDQTTASAVNAETPSLLAQQARRLGAAMIGYSSDYVFDGTACTPYTEEAVPAPLNVYGRTKLEGDQGIAESGASYLIFRTSWVYGARGCNILRTLLRLGQERESLSIIDDQVGAPTTARCLAEATAQIVALLRLQATKQRCSISEAMSVVSGVYNMTCGGQVSWYGFAQEIFDFFGPVIGSVPKLKPICGAEYVTAASRPTYSVLSNRKLNDTFGIEMPHWLDAFRLVAEDLRQSPTLMPVPQTVDLPV